MIINKDYYYCNKCKKAYSFDTSQTYSKLCPVCGIEMEFDSNNDCNTELAEQAKNTPPYDPTQDPKSPYYIPGVKCPNCQSTDTSKISAMSRVVSSGLFGLGSKKIGKQFHCNKCGADF